MTGVIKYRGLNATTIQLNPVVKKWSYSELKSAFEGKVKSIDHMAKELGITKPRAKKSFEEE
mgnify:CR=1 FL=1